MRHRTLRVCLALLLLPTLLLLCSACGSRTEEGQTAQPTVIEEGAAARQEEQAETGETGEADDAESGRQPDPFPDKGEAATPADLDDALSRIDSYYFEQSVPYPSGQVFMQVWYKDGRMKLVTSVDGYCLSESYYDYDKRTVVEVYPGSDQAVTRDFDPDADNAPKNPKMEDYTAAVLTGSEVVGRQLCQVLETAAGDKLWVSTKYGFPLRVEYTDSLGERYQVDYRNLSVNTLTDADLALPDGVQAEQ
ncbi:MAG: hypothetical protein IK116_05740 [Firmicutes bacterium]|nr:hypothetical protein [Bacillota bacterium]